MNRGGILAFLALAASVSAGQDDRAIKTGTQEVLLDVVVRDKRQRMVRDLRPEELGILEDGMPQKIRSFEFVRTKGKRLLEVGVPGPLGPAALHELNLIAIVFHAMSNEGRRNAGQMARDFLRNEFAPNTLLSVFAINRRLYLLQQFTNRPELLVRAVNVATQTSFGQLGKISAEKSAALQTLEFRGGPRATGSTSAERWRTLRLGDASERVPGLDATVATLSLRIARMESTIMRHADTMYDSAASMALVRELAAVPGRKTVLLLSEGIGIDSDERFRVRRLVNEANRANVSFYTLNANGLTTAVSAFPSSQDRIGQALEGEPLRELAEGTGGFAMENSNDLGKPLRRLIEDSSSHYEISYAPAFDRFDGRFRRIDVRVSRPGVKVQAREGYFALPIIAGHLLQPYEIDCLKVLNDDPASDAFPHRITAARSRENGPDAQYQIMFDIPVRAIRLGMAPGGVLSGSISALALLKDQSGNVVDMIGKPLDLRVDPGKLSQFQEASVTLTLPLSVPPGEFVLTTVLLDHKARTAGVKYLRLTAAAAQMMR